MTAVDSNLPSQELQLPSQVLYQMSYFTTSEINLYFTYNSAKRTLTLQDINYFIRFWHYVKQTYCILTLSYSGMNNSVLFYICEKAEIQDIKPQKNVKFWRRLYRLVGYLNILGGQFLFPRV
jgi:hypothetical protein